MASRFKAYTTKYALTSGIEEIEAEDCFSTSPGMIKNARGQYEYYHNKDWHRTREEAVARAEEMRKKKLASLRASIDKLNAMKFQ